MVAGNPAGTGPAVATAGREIVLTRRLGAPRDLVWRALTEHLLLWWGPDGFTNAFTEFELRPHGVWRFVMHGPNGTDYDNKVQFIEVVPPERPRFDHGSGDDDPGAVFRTTVRFETDGAGTQVTLHSLFPTVEPRERAVRDYGAIEGGNQTLPRLAEYVKTLR